MGAGFVPQREEFAYNPVEDFWTVKQQVTYKIECCVCVVSRLAWKRKGLAPLSGRFPIS